MNDKKLLLKPEIQALFSSLSPDRAWSFSHLSHKDTTYLTHGYHRYPAKFIPQLAARLIEMHSCKGETVLDPFMGSGTTLVEARILGRRSIGIDINPVAHLIARAKIEAIEPLSLRRAIQDLMYRIFLHKDNALFSDGIAAMKQIEWPERLRYWFREDILHKLYIIHKEIMFLESHLRTFFECALSHILKTVSYWNDRTIKPIRVLNKRIPDPYNAFFKHIKRMEKGNCAYWQILQERHFIDAVATCLLGDARQLPLQDEEIDLIVTSPPYVTSYEYANLHQLSALWFGYADNINSFREGFIGRTKGLVSNALPHSHIAQDIIEALMQINPRKANEVACYFSEMHQTFLEWKRVLRPKGRAAVVIGNTHISGVEIKNAHVFTEQLQNLGFVLEKTILREISGKTLPLTRDKRTGRFTKADQASYLAYPTEYILIFRKD